MTLAGRGTSNGLGLGGGWSFGRAERRAQTNRSQSGSRRFFVTGILIGFRLHEITLGLFGIWWIGSAQ